MLRLNSNVINRCRYYLVYVRQKILFCRRFQILQLIYQRDAAGFYFQDFSLSSFQ